MSNADVAWLHMDQPTNLMVITGVLWFGEVPAWDRVREVIAERLVAPFPRFSQRVVEGGPRLSGPHWEEDPNFDLDLHLHRVALPAPGDRAALQAWSLISPRHRWITPGRSGSSTWWTATRGARR